jgi:hypothetical protein
MRLEGLGQLKSPMASSGIEPATFLLVAQCLSQLRVWRLVLRRRLRTEHRTRDALVVELQCQEPNGYLSRQKQLSRNELSRFSSVFIQRVVVLT